MDIITERLSKISEKKGILLFVQFYSSTHMHG